MKPKKLDKPLDTRHIKDWRAKLVIYSLHGTFGSQFCDPWRGDAILHSRDYLCPGLQSNSKPCNSGGSPDVMPGSGFFGFFKTGASKSPTHLLMCCASGIDIADWPADSDRLTALLKNANPEENFAKYAGQMSNGVEARLRATLGGSRVPPTGRPEPDPAESRVRAHLRSVWSALRWVRVEQKSIFINSERTHHPARFLPLSARLYNAVLRLTAIRHRGARTYVGATMGEHSASTLLHSKSVLPRSPSTTEALRTFSCRAILRAPERQAVAGTDRGCHPIDGKSSSNRSATQRWRTKR